MRFLYIAFLLIVSNNLFAQSDSVTIETYDIVYLKDGGAIKGQILSFDPSDGDITFISENGIKYFLTAKDYTAFKENIPAKKKKRMQGDFTLNERKENEFELSVGFTIPAYSITGEKSIVSDKHLQFNRSYLPICISAGFGKYINRKHFIGLGVDFNLMSFIKSFYSINLKYAHQYDAYKKNTSFYIPIALTYNHFRNTMLFSIDETDTSYFSDGTIAGTSYPTQREYDVSFNSVGLSIGHGFGFILSNKNSFSFEVSLFKYFGIGSKYYNMTSPEPSHDFSVQGLKMALRYNF